MGKNNNKQQQKQTVKKEDTKVATPVKETAKTNLKATNPGPVKVQKEEKPKVTPPPVEDATGKVVETKAEEVKKDASLVPPTVNDLALKLGPNDLMDANHTAILLDAAERRLSKMDKSKPITAKVEVMVDYNMLWALTKLSVQSFSQKRELNVIAPNDELVVQEMIDMASSMGIALEAHPMSDGQMALTFKEENIDKETLDAAKTEIAAVKKHDRLTDEQMDPLNWKNDDDAKRALKQDLQETKETPSNKFLRLLGKIRIYKQNQETDPVKKNLWDSISLGELTKVLMEYVGKKGIVVLNGLMAATTGSMKCGQTMIFAHSTIRNNMPALKEEEIADLLKTFIELRHSDPAQPIDQDLAIVKGILEPTRDTFVRIALQKPSEKESLDDFKKIFFTFRKAYNTEVGSPVLEDGKDNPNFHLNVVNKMIEIRNLYVDKESAFPLLTAEDFKTVLG